MLMLRQIFITKNRKKGRSLHVVLSVILVSDLKIGIINCIKGVVKTLSASILLTTLNLYSMLRCVEKIYL